MDPLALALAVAVVGVLAVAATGAVLRSLLHVCAPDEALVLSGRTHASPDGGGPRGYRVVLSGRVVLVPVIERVDRLSLAPFPVHAQARGAGVDVTLEATARVSRRPEVIGNAIERFLGAPTSTVASVAAEALRAGATRVFAAPDALGSDRGALARAVRDAASRDFDLLGLELDDVRVTDLARGTAGGREG